MGPAVRLFTAKGSIPGLLGDPKMVWNSAFVIWSLFGIWCLLFDTCSRFRASNFGLTERQNAHQF
jgi:hypothetical protein